MAKVSTSGITPTRLRGAEGAAAPHAALDLVEDERRAAVVADPAGGAQEVGGAVPRAGEALHRLQDHRGDRLVHRRAPARRRRRTAPWRESGMPLRAARLLVAGAVGARRASPRCGRASRRAPRRSSAGRCALRARCRAFSFASAPELQKNTRPSGSGQSAARRSASCSRSGLRHGGRVEEQRGRLLRDGADHVADGSARWRRPRVRRRRRATRVRPRPPARSRGRSPAGPGRGRRPGGGRTGGPADRRPVPWIQWLPASCPSTRKHPSPA